MRVRRFKASNDESGGLNRRMVLIRDFRWRRRGAN